jgi:hypothetical protein
VNFFAILRDSIESSSLNCFSLQFQHGISVRSQRKKIEKRKKREIEGESDQRATKRQSPELFKNVRESEKRKKREKYRFIFGIQARKFSPKARRKGSRCFIILFFRFFLHFHRSKFLALFLPSFSLLLHDFKHLGFVLGHHSQISIDRRLASVHFKKNSFKKQKDSNNFEAVAISL